MPDQIDACLSPKMHEMWNDRDAKDGLTSLEDDEIIGWQVGFVEGADAPDLLKGDDIQKTLGERCEWFDREYGAQGVQGADFRSDALLQIRGLRKTPPRPVDDVWDKDQTWTMLNGEPMKDSLVAGARWLNRRVVFRGGRTFSQFTRARFRLAVMVDVD